MNERLRVAVMRIILLSGTLVAVMGYNFTGHPAFVALPLLAGLLLLIGILRRPPADTVGVAAARLARRRLAMVQITVCCLTITGFLVYNSFKGEWARVAGLGLMLGSLALLEVVAAMLYSVGSRRREEARMLAEAGFGRKRGGRPAEEKARRPGGPDL